MSFCTLRSVALCLILASTLLSAPAAMTQTNSTAWTNYTIPYTSPTDPALQSALEKIDAGLRAKYGMATNETAVGLLDLRTLHLAMIRPDSEDYAASVAKIGILLAFFHLHPEAATNLTAEDRHDLGLMVKASSNEMAAKYSRQIGLKKIQEIINQYHFYDTNHGGGLWVGKHY